MKAKILVVESSELVARTVTALLTRFGYHVTATVATAEAAARVVEHHPPDLALVDLHLSGKVTGLELAARLMEEGVAVAFLSALPHDRSRRLAQDAGVDGFIAKPFGTTELRAGIEGSLERRRARVARTA